MTFARMRSPFCIFSCCRGVYSGDGRFSEVSLFRDFLRLRAGGFLLLAAVISPVYGGTVRAAVLSLVVGCGAAGAGGRGTGAGGVIRLV